MLCVLVRRAVCFVLLFGCLLFDFVDLLCILVAIGVFGLVLICAICFFVLLALVFVLIGWVCLHVISFLICYCICLLFSCVICLLLVAFVLLF